MSIICKLFDHKFRQLYSAFINMPFKECKRCGHQEEIKDMSEVLNKYREFIVGAWIRNLKTQELFEITAEGTTINHDIPVYVLYRKVPFCTGGPHLVPIEGFSEDYKVEESARLLYSKE